MGLSDEEELRTLMSLISKFGLRYAVEPLCRRHFPIDKRKLSSFTSSVNHVKVGQSAVIMNTNGHKNEYSVFQKLSDGRMLQTGYVTGISSNRVVFLT